MKRRLVMAVTCVPIPPDFFDLPLRQMMLPFMGRFPVNSQIFDITISFEKEPVKLPVISRVARIISRNFAVRTSGSMAVREDQTESPHNPSFHSDETPPFESPAPTPACAPLPRAP